MNLLDDEGHLFGVVNVIDVLVVLFVVAVVVAGAALVLSDDPELDPELELETTHATVNLGTHSEAVIEELNEGDAYSSNDLDSLTITDLHFTPEERLWRNHRSHRETGRAADEPRHDRVLHVHASHLVQPSDRGEYELSDATDLLLQSERTIDAIGLDGWRMDIGYPEDRDTPKSGYKMPTNTSQSRQRMIDS